MISACVAVKRTGTFIVAFLIIDFALASVTLTDYIRLARDGGVASALDAPAIYKRTQRDFRVCAPLRHPKRLGKRPLIGEDRK
jgi:hypothetical protein